MYNYDDYDYDYSYEATRRFYRRRKIYLAIVSFILLLIFLIYVLAPVIQALTTPAPQPPPETGPMVDHLQLLFSL